MLAALKRLVPDPLRQALADAKAERVHARAAYSQEGEDLLLMRLFEDRAAGVYVDVGAHHPFRFSNTCLLHRRGWRGINIDARPGSMRLFRRYRPADVNLEVGIGPRADALAFFVFAESALNTFDAALATERQAQGWTLAGTTPVPCRTLASILDEHLPTLRADRLDLLTVDAEGFDLQVLESNDWARFRPRVVVAEILGHGLADVAASPTATFLGTVGYRPSSKLYNSVVFVADDAPPASIRPAAAR